jgi:hypothetical protein
LFNKYKLKIKYPGSSYFHLVVSGPMIIATVAHQLTYLPISLLSIHNSIHLYVSQSFCNSMYFRLLFQ